MQIGMIKGATRTIGKSQGYLGLPLRDIVLDDTVNGPGTPAMETAWLPTPKEIEAINAGAPVILRVLGSGHPPVMVMTGEAPEDAERLPADKSRAGLIEEIAKILAPGAYDDPAKDAFARAHTYTTEAAHTRYLAEKLAVIIIEKVEANG